MSSFELGKSLLELGQVGSTEQAGDVHVTLGEMMIAGTLSIVVGALGLAVVGKFTSMAPKREAENNTETAE